MFAHHGGSLVIDICRNVWVIIMVTLNIKAHEKEFWGGKRIESVQKWFITNRDEHALSAYFTIENGNLKR